jgi:hypothetical protein
LIFATGAIFMAPVFFIRQHPSSERSDGEPVSKEHLNPETEIEMGSAPAPGAVFRVLPRRAKARQRDGGAENPERTETSHIVRTIPVHGLPARQLWSFSFYSEGDAAR